VVPAKRLIQQWWSNVTPLLLQALYMTVLVATLAIMGLPGPGPLRLALLYVLSMWIVAGGIILGIYLARSQASSSDLLAAAARVSASAMWLVPGALLLASRSQLAVGAGLLAVIGSTRMLAARLFPPGVAIRKRRRIRRETEPLLFRYQSEPRAYIWRQAGPAFLATLALQTGIYALSGEYPLLAAVSFATATAIVTTMSVARGATKPAATARTPYSTLRIVLTLLLAVTLTAALVRKEIMQEAPQTPKTAGIPDVTMVTMMSLLERLDHVPPVSAPPASVTGAASKKQVVTRLVNAEPANGAKAEDGIPGVILRPRIQPSPKPPIAPGALPRIAPTEALAFPFTGEYHLFRASSGGLPRGSAVETGTPLERVYATNNGGPMQTVALQTFEPPIDLSLWSKVLVTLTTAETAPVLASMQLVAEDSVEDGGTELMGMNPERKQVLEFQVPFTRRPLLAHAIWISFLRPGPDRNKNVQLAVERLTLVPR
jgi:hypothetical protein